MLVLAAMASLNHYQWNGWHDPNLDGWFDRGSCPMRLTVTEDGSRFLVVTNNTVELEDAISGKAIGPMIRPSARLEKSVTSRDGHFAALMLRSEQEGGHQIQVWDAIVGIALGSGISFSNTPTSIALS